MTGMAADARWMDHALGLAARGLGQVWPNPAVGCVLVRDGRVVGRGWTQPDGRPHAETEAIAHAGNNARGATAYVTLEPCAHQGQTGPCAIALINAGIARAVVAIEDPDARVAGKGLQILRDSGIEVATGIGAAAARRLNAGYLTRIEKGRPWVTLKLASTLDGRIALASGESRWITGPQARNYVHALRARNDAVMIGAGTARADDPMLDVRDYGPIARQPVRIVADAGLSLSLTGRLVSTAKTQPLWLIHGHGIEHERAQLVRDLGVRLIEVPRHETGALDLKTALGVLGESGLTRILCEGGGKLAAGLIRAGLIDELILITAGKVIGSEGVPNIGALASHDLSKLPEFHHVESRMLGPDQMNRWISAATKAQTA